MGNFYLLSHLRVVILLFSDRLFLKWFHMPKEIIFKQLHVILYLVCKAPVWRWLNVLWQLLSGNSLEYVLLLFKPFFIIYLARLITVASWAKRKLIMYSKYFYNYLVTEVDVLTVIISNFLIFSLQTLQTAQHGIWYVLFQGAVIT